MFALMMSRVACLIKKEWSKKRNSAKYIEEDAHYCAESAPEMKDRMNEHEGAE
jgi:hypothetical protein